jgi:hypothetical protein
VGLGNDLLDLRASSLQEGRRSFEGSAAGQQLLKQISFDCRQRAAGRLAAVWYPGRLPPCNASHLLHGSSPSYLPFLPLSTNPSCIRSPLTSWLAWAKRATAPNMSCAARAAGAHPKCTSAATGSAAPSACRQVAGSRQADTEGRCRKVQTG